VLQLGYSPNCIYTTDKQSETICSIYTSLATVIGGRSVVISANSPIHYDQLPATSAFDVKIGTRPFKRLLWSYGISAKIVSVCLCFISVTPPVCHGIARNVDYGLDSSLSELQSSVVKSLPSSMTYR